MAPIAKPIHTKKFGITFDSKYESRIAAILQPFVYQGCGIQAHEKIEIRPATTIFKPRYWACDFKLSKGRNQLLIEAKGYIDNTFTLKLEMLSAHFPVVFSQVRIVTPRNYKAPKSWQAFINQVIPEDKLKQYLDDWIAQQISLGETK